jgi:hypothetical protein
MGASDLVDRYPRGFRVEWDRSIAVLSIPIPGTDNAKLNLVAIGSWTGIAACGVFTVMDFSLSIATPGYDIVGETTSQLMNKDAEYSVLARVSLGVYCVMLIPFVVSVTRHLRGARPLSMLRAIALWVHVFASVTAASFPNDSSTLVTPGITENTVHDRSAEVLFATAFLAVAFTAITERGVESRMLTWISAIVAVIMAVTGLSMAFDVLSVFTGVAERAGLIAYFAWVAVVSRRALGLSARVGIGR